MRYFMLMWALMQNFSMQVFAANAPSVHMLCQSRGGHLHEDCMLINNQGMRLTHELFNTHDDAPTDGMLRIFANVAKTSGGYDWRYGFINAQGQVVAQPIYKEAGAFSSGLALVTTEQGRAYIDTQGRVALQVAAQWFDAHDFHHGLALVRGKGYMTGTHPMSSVGPRRAAPPWSVIDKTGRIVMGYYPAKDTSPAVGYTALEWYSRYSFTAPAINIQSDFKDGYAMFSRTVATKTGHDTAYGMVDTQGRIVVPASTQYSREDELRKKYFPAPKSKPTTVMNEEKWTRVGESYQYMAKVSRFKWTEKQAEVRIGGQIFIDVQARVKAEIKHEQKKLKVVIPFRDGHAVVEIYDPKIDDYTPALMDHTGRIVANYKRLLTQLEMTKR